MPRLRPRLPRIDLGALPGTLVLRVTTLPDHRLLDRLVRGRIWIPMLGVMLAGIVAMQVEVLKLGSDMGRNLQLAGALQSRNELLRQSVASLGDDSRIERLAAGMGMVMPGPTQVTFLDAGAGSVDAAATNLRIPRASGFVQSALGVGKLAGYGIGAAVPSVSSGTSNGG